MSSFNAAFEYFNPINLSSDELWYTETEKLIFNYYIANDYEPFFVVESTQYNKILKNRIRKVLNELNEKNNTSYVLKSLDVRDEKIGRFIYFAPKVYANDLRKWSLKCVYRHNFKKEHKSTSCACLINKKFDLIEIFGYELQPPKKYAFKTGKIYNPELFKFHNMDKDKTILEALENSKKAAPFDYYPIELPKGKDVVVKNVKNPTIRQGSEQDISYKKRKLELETSQEYQQLSK